MVTQINFFVGEMVALPKYYLSVHVHVCALTVIKFTPVNPLFIGIKAFVVKQMTKSIIQGYALLVMSRIPVRLLSQDISNFVQQSHPTLLVQNLIARLSFKAILS